MLVPNELNQPTLEQINQYLANLSKQTKFALDQKDFVTAKKYISQVLTIVPKQVIALTDLALVETRLYEYNSAYQHAQLALKYATSPINANLYDVLTEICHEIKHFEEVRYYGKLAVQARKTATQHLTPLSIPHQVAPSLSPDPLKNIISYSLFGGLPRYCEVAIENAKLAKIIYPEWTCRFYVDDSVPMNIINRLQQHNAQIVYVDEEQKKIPGLFWRFFVNDDPSVRCFIIRDADSLLSYKERAAVDQWLNSGKWFHTMHDADMHTELILAGMWGGFTGIFSHIEELIKNTFCESQRTTRIVDQLFLREHVWPTIAQSVLIHDSKGFDPLSLPFPDYEISDIEKIPYFHIGMIDACNTTKITINHENIKKVQWSLKDENQTVICTYIAEANSSGVVHVNLPSTYTQNIQNQKWHIYTMPYLD